MPVMEAEQPAIPGNSPASLKPMGLQVVVQPSGGSLLTAAELLASCTPSKAEREGAAPGVCGPSDSGPLLDKAEPLQQCERKFSEQGRGLGKAWQTWWRVYGTRGPHWGQLQCTTGAPQFPTGLGFLGHVATYSCPSVSVGDSGMPKSWGAQVLP